MQTFSSAPTATGRFWLSVNLSVFYSPNKIILLFNIKHPISGRNLILLNRDRSSCAGGWKKGGREKQGERCNQTATATSCWGGMQAAAVMLMRERETPTTFTPSHFDTDVAGRSTRASGQPSSYAQSAHSVHSCADIGILFPKTRHQILFWILVLPSMGGLLLIFLKVS